MSSDSSDIESGKKMGNSNKINRDILSINSDYADQLIKDGKERNLEHEHRTFYPNPNFVNYILAVSRFRFSELLLSNKDNKLLLMNVLYRKVKNISWKKLKKLATLPRIFLWS